MNKFIFLITALMLSFNASAAEMMPLSKYIEENPNFKEDPASATYFASRCSALFSKVENRLKQDERKKTQDLVKSYKNAGITYDLVSLSIIKDIGMSEEKFFARYKTLLDAYEKHTVENWKLNGDMFEGWVGDDLQICSENYKSFGLFVKQGIDNFKNK